MNPPVETFGELLAGLPQGASVRPERLAALYRWAESNGQDFDFHYRRLFGFGGSEIGALVRGRFETNQTGRKSATDIVEEKLLHKLPLPPNPDLTRGVQLENLVEKAFSQALNGVQVRRRSDLLQRIKQSFDPKHPWQFVTPDDLLEINGELYIPDYKVPRWVDQDARFDYICQLNDYAAVAQREGVEVAGILLVQLDIPEQLGNQLAYQRLSNPAEYALSESLVLQMMERGLQGFGVKIQSLDIDPVLQADIQTAGDYYWNEFVLKGEMPQKQAPKNISEEDLQIISCSCEELEQWMALSAVSEGKAGALKKNISSKISGLDLKKYAIPSAGLNVHSRTTFDSRSAAEYLQARGIAPEEISDNSSFAIDRLVNYIQELGGDIHRPDLYNASAFNADLIKEKLQELGVELERFNKYTPVIQLGRAKAAKEARAALESEYGECLEDMVSPRISKRSLEERNQADTPQQAEQGLTLV